MGSRPQQPTIIKGLITNQVNSQPIKSATIRISTLVGRTVISTTSDSSGNYKISQNISGVYLIQCSASGYQNMVLLRTINQGQTYNFNFNLKNTTFINNPPQIISISPQTKFSCVSGDSFIVSVGAKDPENDPVSYRFSIDNTVIKDWSSTSTYTYKTSNKDLRRHTLKVEAKDSKAATSYKTVDFFVFMSFPKPGN